MLQDSKTVAINDSHTLESPVKLMFLLWDYGQEVHRERPEESDLEPTRYGVIVPTAPLRHEKLP